MPDTPIGADPPTASLAAERDRPHHTVLVIEDNEDNREIYALYLVHLGFIVLTANDAESGLRIAAEQAPDLVVMDIALPGMDGYAATRLMKATAATAHIPVVVLTAHAMASDRALALEAGCDLYLSKPLDPAALGAELRRFLNA